MVFKLDRIIVGLILCIVIFLTFYLNLDILLIFLILFASFFDLYKSNFLSILNIFILTIFLSLFFSLKFYYHFEIEIYLIFFQVFLVILSIFFKSSIKLVFPIIILNFILIIFNLSISNRNLIYICIFLSFLNDTSAYIFGKYIKGPLILPSISPKKTWSGTIISTLISFILLILFGYSLFTSLFISINFFLGDIYFSFIKRKLLIKDFSNILKSHGGALDRLDSIFFTILIFSAYQIYQ